MIDSELLIQLWHQHAARLLLIVRSMGEPAEDAVQEAFIALATQRDVPLQPLSWLLRVAVNALRSNQRSDLRRIKREQQAACLSIDWFQTSSIDDQLDSQVVTDALRTLEPKTRSILVMHLWGEMTFAEIAEITQSSRSSIHRKYHDGLNQIRSQVESRPRNGSSHDE
ncbi:MAG: sigma-70 family RNA polymerase sigma factor [Planctomycetota bacterium]